MCPLEPTTLAIMSGLTIINDYPTCDVPIQKCLRWDGAEGVGRGEGRRCGEGSRAAAEDSCIQPVLKNDNSVSSPSPFLEHFPPFFFSLVPGAHH